jgi:hypothetical protein
MMHVGNGKGSGNSAYAWRGLLLGLWLPVCKKLVFNKIAASFSDIMDVSVTSSFKLSKAMYERG